MGQASLGESSFDYIDGILSMKYAQLLIREDHGGKLRSLLRNENVEVIKKESGAVSLRGNLFSLLSADKLLTNLAASLSGSASLLFGSASAKPISPPPTSSPLPSNPPLETISPGAISAESPLTRVSPRKAKSWKPLPILTSILPDDHDMHADDDDDSDPEWTLDKNTVPPFELKILPEDSKIGINVNQQSTRTRTKAVPHVVDVTFANQNFPENISETLAPYADIKRIGPEEKRLYGFHNNRGLSTRSKFYELVTPNKYSCDLCSFQTKRKSHLEKHVKMHQDNPVIICPEEGCGYKCISKGDMTKHKMNVHTSEDQQKFKCDQCPFETTAQSSYIRHQRNKHPKKEQETDAEEFLITCLRCEYKTMKAKFFMRHLRKHDIYLEGERIPKAPPEPGHYTCDMCNYETHNKSYLKKHMESHELERKFVCDSCGSSFKRKDILKRHIKSQCPSLGLEKSFLCDVCPKAYKSAYSLKEHKAGHDNLRELECFHCEKRFNTKDMLQKHMKRSHNLDGEPKPKRPKSKKPKKKRSKKRGSDPSGDSGSYSSIVVNEKHIVDQKEFMSGRILMEATTLNIADIVGPPVTTSH